jgi:hypothetical protein
MNNNIIFSFEESELNLKNNDESIQQMMNEFEEEDLDLLNLNLFNTNNKIDNFTEFTEYNKYTVKELIKICNYYEIDNNIKNAKCKKQDIISTIQYYESLPENIEIVQKRKTMWFYIEELLNDTKMKKYVILF